MRHDAFLHDLQLVKIDHMLRGWQQWCMQRDEVTSGEQIIQGHVGNCQASVSQDDLMELNPRAVAY